MALMTGSTLRTFQRMQNRNRVVVAFPQFVCVEGDGIDHGTERVSVLKTHTVAWFCFRSVQPDSCELSMSTTSPDGEGERERLRGRFRVFESAKHA